VTVRIDGLLHRSMQQWIWVDGNVLQMLRCRLLQKNDWPTSYAYSSQKVTRKVQNGWQDITSAQQWLRSATVWPQ